MWRGAPNRGRRVEMRRGRLFATYMVLYGIIRFLLELMRTDTTFRQLGLSRNGWVALGLVLLGASFSGCGAARVTGPMPMMTNGDGTSARSFIQS